MSKAPIKRPAPSPPKPVSQSSRTDEDDAEDDADAEWTPESIDAPTRRGTKRRKSEVPPLAPAPATAAVAAPAPVATTPTATPAARSPTDAHLGATATSASATVLSAVEARLCRAASDDARAQMALLCRLCSTVIPVVRTQLRDGYKTGAQAITSRSSRALFDHFRNGDATEHATVISVTPSVVSKALNELNAGLGEEVDWWGEDWACCEAARVLKVQHAHAPVPGVDIETAYPCGVIACGAAWPTMRGLNYHMKTMVEHADAEWRQRMRRYKTGPVLTQIMSNRQRVIVGLGKLEPTTAAPISALRAPPVPLVDRRHRSSVALRRRTGPAPGIPDGTPLRARSSPLAPDVVTAFGPLWYQKRRIPNPRPAAPTSPPPRPAAPTSPPPRPAAPASPPPRPATHPNEPPAHAMFTARRVAETAMVHAANTTMWGGGPSMVDQGRAAVYSFVAFCERATAVDVIRASANPLLLDFHELARKWVPPYTVPVGARTWLLGSGLTSTDQDYAKAVVMAWSAALAALGRREVMVRLGSDPGDDDSEEVDNMGGDLATDDNVLCASSLAMYLRALQQCLLDPFANASLGTTDTSLLSGTYHNTAFQTWRVAVCHAARALAVFVVLLQKRANAVKNQEEQVKLSVMVAALNEEMLMSEQRGIIADPRRPDVFMSPSVYLAARLTHAVRHTIEKLERDGWLTGSLPKSSFNQLGRLLMACIMVASFVGVRRQQWEGKTTTIAAVRGLRDGRDMMTPFSKTFALHGLQLVSAGALRTFTELLRAIGLYDRQAGQRQELAQLRLVLAAAFFMSSNGVPLLPADAIRAWRAWCGNVVLGSFLYDLLTPGLLRVITVGLVVHAEAVGAITAADADLMHIAQAHGRGVAESRYARLEKACRRVHAHGQNLRRTLALVTSPNAVEPSLVLADDDVLRQFAVPNHPQADATGHPAPGHSRAPLPIHGPPAFNPHAEATPPSVVAPPQAAAVAAANHPQADATGHPAPGHSRAPLHIHGPPAFNPHAEATPPSVVVPPQAAAVAAATTHSWDDSHAGAAAEPPPSQHGQPAIAPTTVPAADANVWMSQLLVETRHLTGSPELETDSARRSLRAGLMEAIAYLQVRYQKESSYRSSFSSHDHTKCRQLLWNGVDMLVIGKAVPFSQARWLNRTMETATNRRNLTLLAVDPQWASTLARVQATLPTG